MGRNEFTSEEKNFLGKTPFRWISMGKVSYNDTDLTEDLTEKLKVHGLSISRKGQYTTEYVKICN